MGYYQQNERRCEVERAVLARPSATSLEYDGRNSQQNTASIHNVIEQKSWERLRVELSDKRFDPEPRGGHNMFSRAANNSRGDQSNRGDSNSNSNNNNHDRQARERSRDRYDDRGTYPGGRNTGNKEDRNGGRNGGYNREEERSVVDRRSNAAVYNPERSRNHHNDDRRRDGYNDEQHRPRNFQSNHGGGDYFRQRDDHTRRSPSYSNHPNGRGQQPSSSHTWREGRDKNSHHASENYPGYERGDQYNGARDDRRRENGNGQRYGVSQASSGNGGGQENGYNQSSSSRQQQASGDDDNGWETVPNRADRRSGERKRDEDEPAPPEITYLPPNDSNRKYQQFMLMLSGVPGSGKSTFAESLVAGKPWMYVRVNQDTLGNRRECEHLTRSILKDGKCPIIDRCNFDPSQRKHFLDIAKSFHNIPVDCIVFQYGMDLCIRRCQSRRNHETITPQIAVEVVQRMVQQFSPPLPNRINSETFRTLKTISDVNSFNDLVMEYLTLTT